METSMEIYNVRLALYTRQCEQRCGKSCVESRVWCGKVSKVVHRVSAIKIYYTLDRSIVKTNQRLFVSFSHTKACNFPWPA